MTHPPLTTTAFVGLPEGATVEPAARRFSYDAIEDKKRRKPPTGTTKSEDLILDQAGRRKLTSSARDIRRNFAIAAWMIRKHLDCRHVGSAIQV